MQQGSQSAPFKHLLAGTRYHAVTSFVDYDGVTHPAGESWIFSGSNFLPHDDGLSLFVTLEDGQSRQIRLQWRPEAQGKMIDSLEDYIA